MKYFDWIVGRNLSEHGLKMLTPVLLVLAREDHVKVLEKKSGDLLTKQAVKFLEWMRQSHPLNIEISLPENPSGARGRQ